MKMCHNKIKVNKKNIIVYAMAMAVVIAFSLYSFIYFNAQNIIKDAAKATELMEYSEHYAFIVDDSDDTFWNNVYEGAKLHGEESGIVIEKLGESLAVNYCKEDLMRIAIASKVDGIILVGDESEEILNLIDEAVESDIPVVTVLTDCDGSKRQSFIGVGGYDLGKNYGREIIRIATEDTKKILVLLDHRADDNRQNLIYTGIRETISDEGNHFNIEVNAMSIEDPSAFSAEEMIRDIFMDTNLPDIIICLNEQNTISAYQAIVDYNMVGKVDIIGYDDSNTILNAIDRKVISSTIAIDSEKMGFTCIDVLNEYIKTGHVSEYVPMDANTITSENVGEYLQYDLDESK